MNNQPYQPILWLGDRVKILDQNRLPFEESYFETFDYLEVAKAIKSLQVRGAPVIGVAAAYGIALGALSIDYNRQDWQYLLQKVVTTIRETRPTARNLFWVIERMEKIISCERGGDALKQALVNEAMKIAEEEVENSRLVSEIGAELIIDGNTILTHCNTGPLATSGSGTALGAIIQAFRQGKKIKVFVDETRPLFQGARLTVWELLKHNIPFTLITDSMSGYFMKSGSIDLVMVGADRIASNGDTANKIGTYSLAIMARAHAVPFYIAAPTSTIDLKIKTGREIIIEKRPLEEISRIRGTQITLENIAIDNPAFDVTPAKHITAIITERGIIKKPFRSNITNLFKV